MDGWVNRERESKIQVKGNALHVIDLSLTSGTFLSIEQGGVIPE